MWMVDGALWSGFYFSYESMCSCPNSRMFHANGRGCISQSTKSTSIILKERI